MKKCMALLLVLAALVIPAFAAGNLVRDDARLLTDSQTEKLEQLYSQYPQSLGFTPILVTTDSFDGLSAEDYAGNCYDTHGYPQDGVLLLVSLWEGEWYILTNGACHEKISDRSAEKIGETLVPMIREGKYYDAFRAFPKLAGEYMTQGKPYGKTIAVCMGVGLLIGLISVGVMAAQMKSVKERSGASDYIRPGSMQITNSRDIFLYSHVTRTARPKNQTSGGGSHSGGRGGAGGKL